MSTSASTSIRCNDFENTDQLIKYYDDWAKEYDKDTQTVRGYICPKVGAKKLVEFLEQLKFGTDCRILDVGSGTGLVGEELKKLNYTNLDALEPSEKSNDVARAKGLYKKFFVELILPGKQLGILPNSYDAVISIGVFTKGNVKAEGAMDEMVRVVKPGGLICFSIREDVILDKEYGYEEKMAQLIEGKVWTLLSKSLEMYHLTGDLFKCHMFVYQVL
ncbi:methyltransferase-like protein 27 [Actinia tenebrosa]|uniref:Methyltransferase-like protein 27 n=1 Tax=Actinia tenebrosa TaxID=6105 RepID=A0A6P8HTD0_ACTTE|nr:methyltransferase-like protein 27 [Actinia tenebrosa]